MIQVVPSAKKLTVIVNYSYANSTTKATKLKMVPKHRAWCNAVQKNNTQ